MGSGVWIPESLVNVPHQTQNKQVFCPKYRFRILKGEVGEFSKREFYSLWKQKEIVEVIELSIQDDHVHVILIIPPKYIVSWIMGFLKGHVALSLFQTFMVTRILHKTVGLNEAEQLGSNLKLIDIKNN